MYFQEGQLIPRNDRRFSVTTFRAVERRWLYSFICQHEQTAAFYVIDHSPEDAQKWEHVTQGDCCENCGTIIRVNAR